MSECINLPPMVILFTGLSCSGKTTLATALKNKLINYNNKIIMLDGDILRKGLNSDLGFTLADRTENARRIAELCKLLIDANNIVICAFILPLRNHRDYIRSMFKKEQFVEIFCDAPLDVCIKRDKKGLYKKALSKELINFTGIDSPYEPPLDPEVVIHTDKQSVEESVNKIIEYLQRQKRVIDE